MISSFQEEELFIGRLLRFDLSLGSRFGKDWPEVDLDALCTATLDQAAKMPLVYTAFDGDHQMACGHMRTFVLQNGGVPANPDSILGYKDTVEHRMSKRGVLLDDLAILRGCDELWIFSDLACRPESVSKLAEGVVIELLFHLKRKSRPTVRFISLSKLLEGESPLPEDYQFSYEETKECLLPAQRDGVMSLANSRGKVDRDLPTLVYHIFDPLDYKYSPWLRSRCYSVGRAPLIPFLAVELQDLPSGDQSLGRVVISWMKLCELATRARLLPSVEPRRRPSLLISLIERAWLRRMDHASIERSHWGDYLIPKVQLGSKWPLTKHEGAE